MGFANVDIINEVNLCTIKVSRGRERPLRKEEVKRPRKLEFAHWVSCWHLANKACFTIFLYILSIKKIELRCSDI